MHSVPQKIFFARRTTPKSPRLYGATKVPSRRLGFSRGFGREVRFFSTTGAVTVKACESVERTCTAPRRRLTETAVRAKHRHSFSYKDKVRFDCSLCVTASVVASRVATPLCTYEVEIEAISDEATAASIMMKVDDIIEMITGTRPTQYTRLHGT